MHADGHEEHYEPQLLIHGPIDADWTVALAHGAGAAMDSPFMEAFAHGLAAEGYRVARFEFPYMARRRATGKKSPPNREPVLRATWQRVIDGLGTAGLVIGGKSLGGRIASMLADEVGAAGLVCLGYPFHPAGKPDRLRVEHLEHLRTPTLILQGTRDALGNREEVADYPLSPAIRVHWLEDGDHSFNPRKSSARTTEDNLREGLAAVVEFLESLEDGD